MYRRNFHCHMLMLPRVELIPIQHKFSICKRKNVCNFVELHKYPAMNWRQTTATFFRIQK
jgi:hypothetical protein